MLFLKENFKKNSFFSYAYAYGIFTHWNFLKTLIFFGLATYAFPSKIFKKIQKNFTPPPNWGVHDLDVIYVL